MVKSLFFFQPVLCFCHFILSIALSPLHPLCFIYAFNIPLSVSVFLRLISTGPGCRFNKPPLYTWA
ncbi:hypothetical protein B0T13DRAFT_468806 [Neurospora crassa]|nr:hypothetical protein B0T13DRAFT_468806 [Neurospora crassa]